MQNLSNFFIKSQQRQTGIGLFWNFDKDDSSTVLNDLEPSYKMLSNPNVYYCLSSSNVGQRWRVHEFPRPIERPQRPRRQKTRTDDASQILEDHLQNDDEDYEFSNQIDPPYFPPAQTRKRSRRRTSSTSSSQIRPNKKQKTLPKAKNKRPNKTK